jgi:opacity protein-like surface antigen
MQGLLGGAPMLLALAATPAAADEAPSAPSTAPEHYSYVGGSIGSIGGDSYDNRYGVPGLDSETQGGVAGDIVWGAKTNHWRFEFGLDMRSQDLETTDGFSTYSGEISARGLVVNAYYDFNTTHGFTPYVGIGVGSYNVSVDDGVVDDDGESFQWQGIVGVAYSVSDRVDLTFDGRYQLLGYDVEMGGGDSTTVNVEGFGFRAGLRYKY